MYQIEVHNLINHIAAVFWRLGMWQNENGTACFKKGKKVFYCTTNLSFAVFMLLRGFQCADMGESMLIINQGILTAVLTVKLSYILWRKKEVSTFINEIGCHSIRNFNDFTQVNKKLEIFMKFVFCYLLTLFFGFLFLLILPAIANEIILPANIWFPLDYKSSALGYWIAFAYCTLSILICVVGSLFVVIIWYLMVNCAVKFEILGNKFTRIGEIKTVDSLIKDNHISDSEKSKSFLQEFIEIIKIHRNIKEYANTSNPIPTIILNIFSFTSITDEFTSCFSHLFFIQIATSGLNICISIYVLTFVRKLNSSL